MKEVEKFTFSEMLNRLTRAKIDMPKKIAEAGQQYFAGNFRKQQTPDGIPWTPRKVEQKYTKTKTIRVKFKPILVNTGALRSAMSNTIISYDYKKIIWGVDITYAPFLNYGTDKMVARPFLADGKEIRGKVKGIIKREFDKIMNVK